MVGIVSRPDTREKLEILSTDAQYDLACACNTNKDEHRRRSKDGKWIYPVTLPNGGKSTLFKTLISNSCSNDCRYCPLREQMDIRRCSLMPEETARVFWDYYNQKKVFGMFLSSGVLHTPDMTMDKLNSVARILRQKYNFKGYIHLKIIPGASNAAIEDAISLASAVSLNIETPGRQNLEKLSKKKRYIQDLIDTGCKLIFFEEYIPVAQGSEDMALDSIQREKLDNIKNVLSEKFNALFIIFPGSEKKYGGCLAAGRGLIHISPDGNLEPCPLIPYSDANVINESLKEALKSQFLMTIRNNGEILNNNSAVCPLRGQQEWINSYFANDKMNQKMKSSGSAFR